MLNILTKYSTMVTNGSTGSTTHVPVMPRAKGFCITTHKQTQRRRRRPPKNLLYWHGDSHDGDFYITHTPQVTAALPHMATYTQRRSLSSYRPQAGPSPSHTDHLHHTYATDDHPSHPSLVSTEREREREAKLGVPCQTSCCASTRNGMPFY